MHRGPGASARVYLCSRQGQVTRRIEFAGAIGLRRCEKTQITAAAQLHAIKPAPIQWYGQALTGRSATAHTDAQDIAQLQQLAGAYLQATSQWLAGHAHRRAALYRG